jgi:hypothetical protein
MDETFGEMAGKSQCLEIEIQESQQDVPAEHQVMH